MSLEFLAALFVGDKLLKSPAYSGEERNGMVSYRTADLIRIGRPVEYLQEKGAWSTSVGFGVGVCGQTQTDESGEVSRADGRCHAPVTPDGIGNQVFETIGILREAIQSCLERCWEDTASVLRLIGP